MVVETSALLLLDVSRRSIDSHYGAGGRACGALPLAPALQVVRGVPRRLQLPGGDDRLGYICPTEIGCSHIGATKVRFVQISSGQVGSCEVGESEIHPT